MDWINEFNLTPGTYEHHKGSIYVVTNVITHMEDEAKNKMVKLSDPLVVYRDLETPYEHVKGRHQKAHKVYALKLSGFRAKVSKNGKMVPRFKHI